MIVLKVDSVNPDENAIRQAADAIRNGDLVIFPTETVYGLAADALNETAVRRVFDLKGRMDNQPLPVQVPDINSVTQVASFIPEAARMLAQKYWPGPLTLVLEKNPRVPDIITAGKNTVGIRVPDHPVALALLRMLGCPIVATSANLSGQPAPKTAQEAIEQLGGGVSVVLDAGECAFGIASTVVDVSTSPPQILRHGVLSEEDIKGIMGDIS